MAGSMNCGALTLIILMPRLMPPMGRFCSGDVTFELNSDPEMPAKLRNRIADNWRPLISIADSLGWGEQAREAMSIFAREFQDADAKILLLSDIRKVFDSKQCGSFAKQDTARRAAWLGRRLE